MVLQGIWEAQCWHLLGFWGGLTELTIMVEGEGRAGLSYMARAGARRQGDDTYFWTTILHENSLTIMRTVPSVKSIPMIQSTSHQGPPPTLRITIQHVMWVETQIQMISFHLWPSQILCPSHRSTRQCPMTPHGRCQGYDWHLWISSSSCTCTPLSHGQSWSG